MVSIAIHTSGKPSILVDFPEQHPSSVTVEALKKAVFAKFPNVKPERQRLTVPPSCVKPEQAKDAKAIVLALDHKTLADYDIPESGGQLRLKDLGPQIDYQTVFFIEYLGPLLIHPLVYVWAPTLYRSTYRMSAMQTTAYLLIIAHFMKREFESALVHKFSHATMPIANVFRNSAHYWLLSGLLVGLTLYRPANSAASLAGTRYDSPAWLWSWGLLWLFAETSNLINHLNLASIRTPPGEPRKYPRGYGFDLVTCSNYFFEILGWVALIGMTGGDFGLCAFLAFSATTMGMWALKKHKTYRKEHGDKYPRSRKVLIPYIW